MTATPAQSHSADSLKPRSCGTKKGGAALVDFALFKFYPNILS